MFRDSGDGTEMSPLVFFVGVVLSDLARTHTILAMSLLHLFVLRQRQRGGYPRVPGCGRRMAI